MNDKSNSIFPTKDIQLASYLLSLDFPNPVITYSYDGRRDTGTFNFQNSPELKQATDDYMSMRAPGDIIKYDHCRNKLMDRLMGKLP